MNSSNDDQSLSRTLADWRVVAPRDPQFRANVWTRIGAGRDGVLPWGVYARTHAGLVAGALVLALMLGAVTGRGQARARAEAVRASIATSYVHDLDARWMRMR